jgi:hypothetical protein
MRPSKRNTRLSVSRRPLPTFRSTSSATASIQVQYIDTSNISIASLSESNVLIQHTYRKLIYCMYVDIKQIFLQQYHLKTPTLLLHKI